MIDLKAELGSKYDDLLRCDFIKDIEDILSNEGLINIDFHDIKAVCKGEIIGAISAVIEDLDDELEINRISDKEPNGCLLNVTSSMNLRLQDIDKIIGKIKKLGSDLSFIYGTNIDNNYDGKYKIQALLTYNDGIVAETNKNIEEPLNENKLYSSYDEKELLYNAALYVINNGATISNIQVKFGLGFNRALNILNKLEELGIISQKVGTNPRNILISDKNKIKELIYR